MLYIYLLLEVNHLSCKRQQGMGIDSKLRGVQNAQTIVQVQLIKTFLGSSEQPACLRSPEQGLEIIYFNQGAHIKNAES